ncbi:MAG: sugar transferase [Candidatus Binatia bacterium]|nr:sugar transferase [Candidatus Binatia bacterium]
MRQRTLSYQATLLCLVLADLLWVVVAYVAAFWLRMSFPLPLTTDLLPVSRFSEVTHPVFFLPLTQVGLLYFFGFYDLHAIQHQGRVVTRVITALGVQVLATTTWYFFRGDLFFPRSVLVLFWLLNTAGVAGMRLWIASRLGRVRPLAVLLVGTVEEVRTFLAGLPSLRPFPQLRIVGLVGVNGTGSGQEEMGIPWLGRAEDLHWIAREVQVKDIIVLSPTTWKDTFVDHLLRSCNGTDRPRVLVVPSVYDILVGRVAPLRLHDVPLVEVLKDPQEDMAFLIKGVLDRVIAGLLLVLATPLLCLAGLLIKCTSPGPMLYRQQRIGRGGKVFTLYKFRTMVDGAETHTGPVLASRKDERVTWVGRILRDSRIDELPQLFNVLNGTMSLVGPRPERPEFVQEFLRTIPGYAERLQVKPGLTGLAQVNGEYHTTPEYKLKYDLAYIYNYSLWLDVRILAETVKVMLMRRGV